MVRPALAGGAVGLVALAATLVAPATAGAAPAADDELYLVALRTAGTSGYDGGLSTADYRAALVAQQDMLLAGVDAPEPVYRWTTALNGVAVRLSALQAEQLADAPQVRLVERDRVRRLTGTADPASVAGLALPGRGGRGVVVGLVDTGLDPDGPAFANRTGLGPAPDRFRGSCEAGGRWSADACGAKVVGGRYFLDGFGAERLRAGADESPYDDDGHGTQLASLAAGNAGVNALDGDQDHGTFSGVAPLARVAAYKACWAAPDPADDGCSSADVVAAVDAAVQDRVDVLTVAIDGSSSLDTVDLALLGAAERDIVVAAAAGNDGGTAGHAQPWVTTVGGTTGPQRPGRLLLDDGTSLDGVLTARQGLGRNRIVDGARIPAPGRNPDDARFCLPGSLDAGRAGGRIVVCERGRSARVDKSAAVDLADGAGMVLVDSGDARLPSDFHAVPTLHLGGADGRALRASLARPGPLSGRFEALPAPGGRARVLGGSASGDVDASVVKPDLVAPAAGLLAASSPYGGTARWELASGTSAATALTAGWAARVRGSHPTWSAARVRSALATSSRSTAGEPGSLRQGAGRPQPDVALAPGLVYDVARTDWRNALSGDAAGLNLPSVLTRAGLGTTVVTRRVTNVSPRTRYYSSRAWGFARHRVRVTPAALRLAPGESATYRIRVTRTSGGAGAADGRGRAATDSGWVAWTGSDDTRSRIPVVLTP